jgi:hypothetical protein
VFQCALWLAFQHLLTVNCKCHILPRNNHSSLRVFYILIAVMTKLINVRDNWLKQLEVRCTENFKYKVWEGIYLFVTKLGPAVDSTKRPVVWVGLLVLVSMAGFWCVKLTSHFRLVFTSLMLLYMLSWRYSDVIVNILSVSPVPDITTSTSWFSSLQANIL